MQESRILVVETPTTKSNSVVPALEKVGLIVETTHTGNEALEAMSAFDPHLVIVNSVNRRSSGSRICRRIRRQSELIPIIHCRMPGEPEDRSAEADVYLQKPFASRRLLNRVRALLPIDPSREEMIRYGPITLYRKRRMVDVVGKGESQLTPKLAKLLEVFLRHPNQIVDRKALMEEVWKTSYLGDTRTLEVHVRWVRERIEQDPSKPTMLKTARKKGYMLTIPEQNDGDKSQ